MLFALLAILAATFDARLSGSRFEEYVSAPADPQGEAAPFANATLSAAEDLEEEADQDEATFLALATLHCASEAGYQAQCLASSCPSPLGPFLHRPSDLLKRRRPHAP